MILTLVTGQLATVSSLRGIDAGETHLAILKAAAGYHIRTAGGVCCWILSIWPNIWVITWTMVSSLQHGHPDQEKKDSGSLSLGVPRALDFTLMSCPGLFRYSEPRGAYATHYLLACSEQS